MAVIGVDVTEVPTEVAGLDDDTIYIVQNQGEVSIYVDTGSVAPADSAAEGIEIAPRLSKGSDWRPHTVKPTATDNVYMWTKSGVAHVALAEAIQ